MWGNVLKCGRRCREVCWGCGEMLGEMWGEGVEKCLGGCEEVLGEV